MKKLFLALDWKCQKKWDLFYYWKQLQKQSPWGFLQMRRSWKSHTTQGKQMCQSLSLDKSYMSLACSLLNRRCIDIGMNQTFEIPQSVLGNQVFSYKWDELEFWWLKKLHTEPERSITSFLLVFRPNFHYNP